jgi:lipopolysaccharide transport system permease protein
MSNDKLSNNLDKDFDGWSYIISPKSKLFRLNLREVWEYRDLISLFVRRDIVSVYKQTVLGPVWFLFGPIFTVFTYTFLFKTIANLSTDNLPGPLFYLAGTTLWNYFQACFNGASSTFTANSNIFGKVYFPRLVSPISLVISNLFKLFVQMITFLVFLTYYMYNHHPYVHPNTTLFMFPIYLLLIGGIALGSGILISSFTTKYRDINMLIGVFISLLMYASPIMYPSSKVPLYIKPVLDLNPLSSIIEAFRYSFTGQGNFNVKGLMYSFVFMICVLFVGILTFNKTERNFMDTV